MSQAKRLIRFLPTFIILALCVPFLGIVVTEGSKILGLRTVPVFVAGTGSMYPSLFWSVAEGGPEDETQTLIPEYRTTPHLYYRFPGLAWQGHFYFKPTLGRGDLVAFQNSQTAAILTAEHKDPQVGFIKRIIAIPGDTIELRDGFVYLNGTLLSEPYLSASRSTYGGSSLADCHSLTLPPEQYFVMGDNRKVSSDSRYELGLVRESDISHYLPYQQQQIYHSLYHDTSADPSLLGQATLETTEFITLINATRRARSLPALKQSPSLTRSAELQGIQILSNPTSKLSLTESTARAGYTNTLLGEFISHGHYNSRELLENLLYHAGTAQQVLSPDYSDLGLSVVNREVDGCPQQVIVGHLGGYLPPSYDQATRDSWTNLIANLREVIPSWEAALGDSRVDQTSLNELLTILRRRLELALTVSRAIENQEWLNDSLQQQIAADQADAERANALAKELNRD